MLAKPHRALFHEFKGGAFYPEEVEGSGDVKYHLGASADREFDGRYRNPLSLLLLANQYGLGADGNVMFGLDGRYRIGKGTTIHFSVPIAELTEDVFEEGFEGNIESIRQSFIYKIVQKLDPKYGLEDHLNAQQILSELADYKPVY